MQGARLIKIAVIGLIAAAVFYACTRTFVDLDLWWHLRLGLDFLKAMHVSFTEPYSFLTGHQKVIIHELFSDCAMAMAYQLGGWTGLVLLKTAVVCVLLGLMVKFLNGLKADFIFTGISVLIVSIFLGPATNVVRPHMFTCTLLTALFLMLRSAKERPNVLWFSPLLFALWVNVHGGFIVGLVTYFTWTLFATIFYRDAKQLKITAWSTLVVSAIALCINPYGMDLPSIVFHVALMPHPGIAEWQPMELVTSFGLLWGLTVIVSIVALSLTKQPRDIPRIIVWLAFAAAPLVSVRHIQFFGLATIYMIGEHLLSLWQMRATKTPTENSTQKLGAVDYGFVAISGVIALVISVLAIGNFYSPKYVMDQTIPQTAVGILKKIGAKGNMVVDFDWGAFVFWHLSPDVKVSFDSRREFAYSDAASLANYVFFSGIGPWDYLLRYYKIDIVLVHTHSPAYSLMKTLPNWKDCFEDGEAALFFPSDSPMVAKTEQLTGEKSDIYYKDFGHKASVSLKQLDAPLF
ncbi:MAG TPA: hypothetical protein V6C86_19390 [Oculatellaceae cyanobacterium]